VIELGTYRIGWFQGRVLHGQGRRIEPNEFPVDGYFDHGRHTPTQTQNALTANIEIARKINWNDYISIGHHYDILNQAIADEG
jgi:hypothetical protein